MFYVQDCEVVCASSWFLGGSCWFDSCVMFLSLARMLSLSCNRLLQVFFHEFDQYCVGKVSFCQFIVFSCRKQFYLVLFDEKLVSISSQ